MLSSHVKNYEKKKTVKFPRKNEFLTRNQLVLLYSQTEIKRYFYTSRDRQVSSNYVTPMSL